MIATFPKPVVVVSKCLGFARCRYDGQILANRFVDQLGKYATFKTICPEIEIGLGVPRCPIRIVHSGSKRFLYQPATGLDLTRKMNAFSRLYLDSLDKIDGFILKSRSPTCGIGDVKVFHGLEQDAETSKDSGFFGEQVLLRFPGLAVEDENRLNNFSIREHFLTKLFTLARFRKIKGKPSLNGLAKFHTDNKMLLLSYNQSRLRRLGELVANRQQADLKSVLSKYEAGLHSILRNPPKHRARTNKLNHMFGEFFGGSPAGGKKPA
jgi:uncharacterized protein YbbK (DUF523 family)